MSKATQPDTTTTPPPEPSCPEAQGVFPSAYDLGCAYAALELEYNRQDARAADAAADSKMGLDAAVAMEAITFQQDALEDLILARPLPTLRDAAAATLVLWLTMARFAASRGAELANAEAPSARWRNALARVTIATCQAAGLDPMTITDPHSWSLVTRHAREGVAP